VLSVLRYTDSDYPFTKLDIYALVNVMDTITILFTVIVMVTITILFTIIVMVTITILFTVIAMITITIFVICVTNDHGYVPFVVSTSRSFPHS
jgi:hypothetical protein